jgi:hypothetical protein
VSGGGGGGGGALAASGDGIPGSLAARQGDYQGERGRLSAATNGQSEEGSGRSAESGSMEAVRRRYSRSLLVQSASPPAVAGPPPAPATEPSSQDGFSTSVLIYIIVFPSKTLLNAWVGGGESGMA